MDTKSIAHERLNGPEWQAFLEALGTVEATRDALMEGVADEDAEEIHKVIHAELARRDLVGDHVGNG